MSDRNVSGHNPASEAFPGILVGTAGHIDHGKTSLIRALTGIDTDRLAEEKKRGISIDLGFAHLTLFNQRRIGFIDVPGHERFIKNMLAGIGGIQAVLLIVAADESVKPQTREHFEICRLLGVEHGLIVLTKADLASAEQLRKASADVQAVCAGSFLDGASVIPVSAVTGAGLEDLQRALALLAERVPVRDSSGLARLPIDRSFALKGFGTVVTGTLWSGMLRSGDAVQIHPSGVRLPTLEARIRGLQVHGKAVNVAVAGQRTAVNIAGSNHSGIRRGFVLTHKGGLETTDLVDVSLEWLRTEQVPQARRQFLLYIGAAEIPVALKVLSMLSACRTMARLWLSQPVLALPGDRLILRSPSPGQTVAGGFIIDVFPVGRLSRAKTVMRLARLAQADPGQRLEILIEESATGRRVPELVRLTGRPLTEIRATLASNPKLVTDPTGQRVVSTAWMAQHRGKLQSWLAAYHSQNPSASGAPVSLSRMGLDPVLAGLVFSSTPGVRVQGESVSLASHTAQLSGAEIEALSKIERAFRDAGFQPPAPAEILAQANIKTANARGLLERLIKNQKLVRVSENLVFHADAIAQIRNTLSSYRGRPFSVPEFKEWTRISRKYAIPLLEYLDHQRITRRNGDARIVL